MTLDDVTDRNVSFLVKLRFGYAWGPWKSRGGELNDLSLLLPHRLSQQELLAVRNLWYGIGTESDRQLMETNLRKLQRPEILEQRKRLVQPDDYSRL